MVLLSQASFDLLFRRSAAEDPSDHTEADRPKGQQHEGGDDNVNDYALRPTSVGKHLLDDSLEGEHVHALRSRERGCFLVVQTLWVEKIQSTTDAGSLNTFGRNEIEVAPISSALLRIACLVILYKTCRVPDQELAADGVSGPV